MTWEAVIGLEVHVQLGTKTKAFSPSAIRFGAEPNSLTDPTVLGLPGALPTFNRAALEKAIALGIAVGGTVRHRSRFARKQYFYPDLPKGYQISQFDEPLIEGGSVEYLHNGAAASTRLTRIHLEEDAGKSIHGAAGSSLVDLNRAGVPLCEIVSEPAIHSAMAAAEYMRALRRLVRTLGISDGDMEKGQLRCDANVSLRPSGSTSLGVRAELKNINSFKFVAAAIEHEIARQSNILDSGGTVVQETRLWDSARGVSRPMRSKEEAMDYRYFPDPDLPPLDVSKKTIEAIASRLPELPEHRRRRLHQLGVAEADAGTLIDDLPLARYFDGVVREYDGPASSAANWILGDLGRELAKSGISIDECKVSPLSLAGLLSLIDRGTISGKIAKELLAKMVVSGEHAESIIEREDLRQISDSGAIEAIAAALIDANPLQVEQYRSGKTKVLGFFVGQVMKETRGKANPRTVNEVLERLLGEDP